MVRSRDGVAFRIVSPGGGRPSKIEEARGPGAEESGGTVNLTTDELRDLFEGPPILRAKKIAQLTGLRFELVFGRYDSATHDTASELRRIGRAVVDPVVVASFTGDPAKGLPPTAIRFLRIAARERDPYRQLQAALEARLAEKMRQAERKARR